jgi:DNA-binding MarR family transcriptional regulator
VTAGDPVPLARLMVMGVRRLVDDLHLRLAEEGWGDVREAYGFVLLSLRDHGATTTTGLAGTLGVTKQATSKLLDAMEAGGYVERRPAEGDGRIKEVTITSRGRELLEVVEAIYAELEAGWADVIGPRGVEDVRRRLDRVVRSQHGGTLPRPRPT